MSSSPQLITINSDDYFTTDPGVPFHLLRRQKPSSSNETASNQLNLHELDNMFNKFNEKNIKDSLSSFLPHLPGYVDAPGTTEDSLQSLIDKPPVGGRELAPLTESSLQGFRLMPGSVPDQYKFLNKPPDKKKKKKRRHNDDESYNGQTNNDLNQERKHKKKKKDDNNGERKKKEKKKKKKKDKKGED